MDRLAKDMESPEIDAGLREVMGMADSLQINGTPSFVVGDEVVVGAVGYDAAARPRSTPCTSAATASADETRITLFG